MFVGTLWFAKHIQLHLLFGSWKHSISWPKFIEHLICAFYKRKKTTLTLEQKPSILTV